MTSCRRFWSRWCSAEGIKRPPPDEAQLARIAVEDAMNDGSLQTGDIIVTTKGFVRFLGMKPDGSSTLLLWTIR
jgi:hypothetical protein